MKQIAIGYFVILFAANAFAISSDIPYCKAVEVRDQLVGFKCKTQNNWSQDPILEKAREFVFEIVVKTDSLVVWKDPAGKKWTMPPKQGLSQADSMKSCREIGGVLPTRMQLAFAKGEAFYEALAPGRYPSLMSIWTSDRDLERSNEFYQYGYYTYGIGYWPVDGVGWSMSQWIEDGAEAVCLIKP